MAITSHCITQSQTRKALLSCPVSVLAHETPILYDHPPPEQPPIMLFKREKHGAPVRRDFSHMVQKCKKAVAESSSATAVVSVPNLRSKAPTHHQVFWLMQPGAAEDLPKTPRAASCLLMGSRPQWPPFGAKPRNCKYSYGVSPGFPPGSF